VTPTHGVLLGLLPHVPWCASNPGETAIRQVGFVVRWYGFDLVHELQALCSSGDIKVLRLPTAKGEKAAVLMSDYTAQVCSQGFCFGEPLGSDLPRTQVLKSV